MKVYTRKLPPASEVSSAYPILREYLTNLFAESYIRGTSIAIGNQRVSRSGLYFSISLFNPWPSKCSTILGLFLLLHTMFAFTWCVRIRMSWRGTSSHKCLCLICSVNLMALRRRCVSYLCQHIPFARELYTYVLTASRNTRHTRNCLCVAMSSQNFHLTSFFASRYADRHGNSVLATCVLTEIQ